MQIHFRSAPVSTSSLHHRRQTHSAPLLFRQLTPVMKYCPSIFGLHILQIFQTFQRNHNIKALRIQGKLSAGDGVRPLLCALQHPDANAPRTLIDTFPDTVRERTEAERFRKIASGSCSCTFIRRWIRRNVHCYCVRACEGGALAPTSESKSLDLPSVASAACGNGDKEKEPFLFRESSFVT